MAGPNYGALGATFKAVRILQIICMIAVIGMTANFIAQMVNSNNSPPEVLVGTISVVCIAVLYCVITFILFLDGILPFLISTGLDGVHLIAVIVVAVVVGKPLSYLKCDLIGEVSGDNTSAYAFTTALGQSLAKAGEKISYTHWIGASQPNCLQMKAIWGFSIALCFSPPSSTLLSIDATKLGASIGPRGSTLGAVLEIQSPYDGKWFSVGLTCFHSAIANKDETVRGAAEKACFAKWKADGIKVDDPHRSALRCDLPALKDHQHRMSIITREEERVHEDSDMIEVREKIAAGEFVPPYIRKGYETTLGSLSQNSAIKQRAEDFFVSSRAYLGNVWCASGFRLSPTTPPSELDWALIMLKSSRIGPNKIPPQIIGGFVFDNDDLAPPFTRELEAGQSLFKVGRRTGFTHGFYDGLYSVNLNPGRVDAQGELIRTPTYERAITCPSSEKRFSKEGDSGSVIFNSLGQFVGLLWAGNEATNTTYFTPWKILFEDIIKMTGAKDVRVATRQIDESRASN